MFLFKIIVTCSFALSKLKKRYHVQFFVVVTKIKIKKRKNKFVSEAKFSRW